MAVTRKGGIVSESPRNSSTSTRRVRRRSQSSGSRPRETKSNKQDTDANTGFPVQTNGSGMTIWWLVLSLFACLFRWEQSLRKTIFGLRDLPAPLLQEIVEWFYLTSPHSSGSWIRLMQGVATTSAVCVGIGYYTFKIPFRIEQGSMAYQLYMNNIETYPFPFWTFYVLDFSVHVVIVALMWWYWWKYVDSLSAFIAFCYHRLWSYVHSRGESVYFTRVEEVYGFRKPMPAYSYILLYFSETLIVGTALFQSHVKYAEQTV